MGQMPQSLDYIMVNGEMMKHSGIEQYLDLTRIQI